MKVLHTVTAALEGLTGLALMATPSLVVTLLLGTPLDSVASETLGRITGAALLTVGVMCWLARNERTDRPGHGLIPGMLLYNILVAVLLAFAGITEGLVGVALWPAVGLHVVMSGWCIACLKRIPSQDSLETQSERN